jgi:hypothetical protein
VDTAYRSRKVNFHKTIEIVQPSKKCTEHYMTPDNTQKLFDAFPHLYRGRIKSLQESLMSWGFTCGDGWFDLVWTLSQDIENSARTAGLEPQSNEWPEAVQVKEKFGMLRFHLKRTPLTTSYKVVALIREAELRSAIICEECGKPLALIAGHELVLLCEEHAKLMTKPTNAFRRPPSSER